MKVLFSYSIWFAVIASSVTLFFYPNSPYITYANNMLVIYEIISWATFLILALLAALVVFGSVSGVAFASKEINGEKFIKAFNILSKEKRHYLISRYLHYVLIIFIGVFLGDISLTIVLTFNAFLYQVIKKYILKIFKEQANV